MILRCTNDFSVFPHTLGSYTAAMKACRFFGESATGANLDKVPLPTKQLLDALSHVHRAHIVHGDLNPENILVSVYGGSPDSGGFKAVLAVFGAAATVVAPPSSAKSYTELEGHCHTTYQDRAPELLSLIHI